MREKIGELILRLIPARWLDYLHRHKKVIGPIMAICAFTGHIFDLHELETSILYVGTALGVGALPNGRGYEELRQLHIAPIEEKN